MAERDFDSFAGYSLECYFRAKLLECEASGTEVRERTDGLFVT